ncbi:PA2169 family four-helix-bundle protein [Mucilaginibacter polytrichastri]|uniref:Uncharacterized protein n=1 Tax=Mucilaginibacter polytrichastri TaxID=1302689 RepID=A0A1Q6A6P5_9SPHI|nr:PA2169 family four-helix-bundle protein [Mucilaginibacter polytrichastri]OKS89685.1 hypothetical protein RG47T_5170 [Mucilaginibacter polytrichastri]SFT25033.1 hypothetical protein SAMN04487890_12276 [Mucilaginibacter polytrichastri]
METIKAASLKSKAEVIDYIKGLLSVINDGKEGYQSAAEATENTELKALFSKFPVSALFTPQS